MNKTKTCTTRMKVLKGIGICLTLTIAFSGCGAKDTVNSNQPEKPANNGQSVQVEKVSETEKELNKFFFQSSSPEIEYVYRGTVWGENIMGEVKPEEKKEEGQVGLTVKLTVAEVAKLSKGKIFELNFSSDKAKNITASGQKLFLWVTDSEIYICPFKSSEEAKKLEANAQLPSLGKDALCCGSSNLTISAPNNPNEKIEMKVENNTCTYSKNNDGNSNYEKFVWQAGKGLTHYSWGYGAAKEGIKIDLAESAE